MASASAQTALGPQRTAVVLMNWKDVQTQPTTVARAISDMTSVRAWYQRSSYGAMDLPFDVYGWVTADVDASGKCMTGLADTYGAPLMVAQIGQSKWDTYAKRLWVLPTTAAPGVRCYPNASLCGRDAVVYDNVGPALHELGHTFCLPHVDARDKMSPGAGPWTFGPVAKTALGWLDRSGQPTTQLVTSGGVYAIEGYETAARGVKALRVRAKTGGLFGTNVYWVKSVNSGEVAIQDVSGNDVNLGGGDVVLNVGQSWTSPEGITIRTESASTAGASIRVAYAGEATPAPVPVVQSGPTVDVLTPIGGSARDSARGLVAMPDGGYAISGDTQSPNFPRTTGQTLQGNSDAFVQRRGPDGALICSALIGGPAYDAALDLDLLPNGNFLVSGTAGIGLPTTPGVVQPTFGGDSNVNPAYGPQDGFVAEVQSTTCAVVWMTYIGDNDRAFIRDAVADSTGIYLGPTQTSVDQWYVTQSPVPPLQPTRHAGSGSGTILKISLDGTTLLWGSYVDGTGLDGGTPSLKVTDTGVYMLMGTSSTDLPVTMPSSYGGGSGDLYLVKFAKDGSAREFARYVGGTGKEWVETHGLAICSDGRIAIGGATNSPNWPSTTGATLTGTDVDFGLAVLSADAAQILAGTFYGTTGGDWVDGLNVSADCHVLATGIIRQWDQSGGVIRRYPADLSSPDVALLYDNNGHEYFRNVAELIDGRIVAVGEGNTALAWIAPYQAPGGQYDILVAIVRPPVPQPPSPCVVNPLALTVVVTGSHPIIGWTGSVTATDDRGCQATEAH